MDMNRILPNASTLLWDLLAKEGLTFTEGEREAYALGKLSVLLDLETLARMIEDVRGMTLSDETRFTVSSSLRTVQSSLRSSHHATVDDWYNELLRRFSDAAYDVDDQQPRASFGADPHSTAPLPGDTDELDLEDTLSALEELEPPPSEPNE